MFELRALVDSAYPKFSEISEDQWRYKPSPGKWSKIEILGHLVDSALNNLQRFTEINFSEKPYRVRSYDQDKLVAVNHYQHQPVAEVIELWVALNKQISYIMSKQNHQALKYAVKLPQGQLKDLNWLMEDYMVHLKHHLKQLF